MNTRKEQPGPDFTPRPAFFSKENLWVNGPLLSVIVIAAVTGTALWLDIRSEVKAMRVTMEAQYAQTWRVGHAAQAMNELARKNPNLVVPDAYEIHARIK